MFINNNNAFENNFINLPINKLIFIIHNNFKLLLLNFIYLGFWGFGVWGAGHLCQDVDEEFFLKLHQSFCDAYTCSDTWST